MNHRQRRRRLKNMKGTKRVVPKQKYKRIKRESSRQLKILVIIMVGVRIKSQTDETTSPNANPERPATSAPANVAIRKIAR